MKICLVSNLYPPTVQGGAELYVSRLAAALAPDHTVVVVTSEPGAHLSPHREVSANGVVTYRLAPLNIAHLTTLPHRIVPQAVFRAIDFYHLQVAGSMRDIMTRERPDVVHVHNWIGLSLAAILSGVEGDRINRVPVAMTVHDYGLCCIYADLRHPDGRGCPPRLPCRIMTPLNRQITQRVNLAIGPSAYVLEEHRRRGFFTHAEQAVVANGIPSAPSPAARTAKETFDLVFLGRVQQHKGPQVLIQAFRRLADPSLRLHIAGAGPDAAACQALAGGDDRIRFYGFIQGEALRGLMGLADSVVVPSLWPETFGLVALEAFQSGAVVIASRVGALPELVQDGVSGLLVDPGNEPALAAAIERVRTSPELVAKLRAEGLRRARLYDMTFHTAHLVDAYSRLIATNRVGPLKQAAA